MHALFQEYIPVCQKGGIPNSHMAATITNVLHISLCFNGSSNKSWIVNGDNPA